jgi:hypothetical protein
LHVIVVDNVDNFLVYVLTTGTYQYDGFATTCPFSQNLNDCLAAGVDDIAVRGWRSASRNFVQNGTGPNAAAPDQGKARTALPATPNAAKLGTERSAHLLDRYGIDIRKLDRAALQRAEARVRSGKLAAIRP